MNPINKLIHEITDLNLWNKEITIERNDYLKTAGTVDTNIYLVLEGCIRIFVIDPEEEHTIRFGYQNNLIAALDSFINEQPSDFYMQALKKSRVKVIDKSSFMTLIESSVERKETYKLLLENFVLQQMERERDILTSSPLKRFHRVLNRSPHLFQEVPHKYIASYLRMTPETLSRIKKS